MRAIQHGGACCGVRTIMSLQPPTWNNSKTGICSSGLEPKDMPAEQEFMRLYRIVEHIRKIYPAGIIEVVTATINQSLTKDGIHPDVPQKFIKSGSRCECGNPECNLTGPSNSVSFVNQTEAWRPYLVDIGFQMSIVNKNSNTNNDVTVWHFGYNSKTRRVGIPTETVANKTQKAFKSIVAAAVAAAPIPA